MAEIARRVLPIAGYAVGGLPGFIFGTILGGLLFPAKSNVKPEDLADIKLSGPARGAPLPILHGSRKLRGDLIWVGPLITIEGGKKDGGKGLNKGSGERTYRRSFAFALCEGRPTNQLIQILVGDDVLYDVLDPTKQDESGIDFTFYPGTANQDPDLRMAAYQNGGLGTTTQQKAETVALNGTGLTHTLGTVPIVVDSDRIWTEVESGGEGGTRLEFFTRVGSSPGQNEYMINPTTGLISFGGSYSNVLITIQYQIATQTSTQEPLAYPYVCYIYLHEVDLGPSPAVPPNLAFILGSGGHFKDDFNRADDINGIDYEWDPQMYGGGGGSVFQVKDNRLMIRQHANESFARQGVAVPKNLTPGTTQWAKGVFKGTPTLPDWVQDASSGFGVRLHDVAVEPGNQRVVFKGYAVEYIHSGPNLPQNRLRLYRGDGAGGSPTKVVLMDVEPFPALAVNDVLKIEAVGPVITVYVNDEVVITHTDATYLTGLPGLVSTYGHASAGFPFLQPIVQWDDVEVAVTGAPDVNPLDIIVDYITNPIYGASLPWSILDLTSRDAEHAHCEENDLLISALVETPQSCLRAIEHVLAHYFGWIGYLQGKIRFGTRRPQTITREIVRTDALQDGEGAITMPGYRDTKNMVRIDWTDRIRRYTSNQSYLSDDFDRPLTGTRLEAIALDYCCRPELATKLASKYFYLRAVPQMGLSILLGPKEIGMAPGDVAALTDSALGLSQAPVRILSVSESEDRGEFRLEIAEEPAAAMQLTTYPVQEINSGDAPPPVTADPGPTMPQIVELPEELTAGAIRLAFLLGGIVPEWSGASIWMSLDGTTYTKMRTYLGPSMPIGAFVEQPIFRRDIHYDDLVGFDIDFVTMGLPGSTVRNSMLAGVNQAYTGGEFLTFRDAELVSGSRYTLRGQLRGWHDSGPIDLVQSMKLGVFRVDAPTLEFTIGQLEQTFFFKFPSINHAGVESDLAGLPVYSAIIQGLARQPDPVYGLQLSQGGIRQGSKTVVASGEIDVTVAWLYARYANVENADLVDGNELISHELTFLDFVVRVSSKSTAGGSYTVRRTVTGISSESYTYTSAANVTDAGSYQRFIKFEVWVRRETLAASPIKTIEIEVTA